MKPATVFCLAALGVLLSNEAASGGEKSKELVVVSFGGSFQEAQRRAFLEPFTKKTGIRIREVSYDGGYEKLRSQVASGRPAWDVVDVESAVLARGSKEGLFEPLPEKLTAGYELLPGTRTTYGVGADVYATMLAYREGEPAPRDWRDFFDARAFPGARSMRRNPRGTLEFARLNAAGPPIYPLDVDLAFTQLQALRPHIRVWWTSGQQPIDLLDKGTVRMAAAWSGRVWAARKAGKRITGSYHQALVEAEYWVILKGSRNRAGAESFIAYTLDPVRQAEMADLFGVGPTNPEALKHIRDPETLRWLPTTEANRKTSLMFDPDWWLEHEGEVQPRWEQWLNR